MPLVGPVSNIHLGIWAGAFGPFFSRREATGSPKSRLRKLPADQANGSNPGGNFRLRHALPPGGVAGLRPQGFVTLPSVSRKSAICLGSAVTLRSPVMRVDAAGLAELGCRTAAVTGGRGQRCRIGSRTASCCRLPDLPCSRWGRCPRRKGVAVGSRAGQVTQGCRPKRLDPGPWRPGRVQSSASSAERRSSGPRPRLRRSPPDGRRRTSRSSRGGPGCSANGLLVMLLA